MRKGLTFLPSLVLTVVLSLPTIALANPDADTVVARVNGEDITLGHMIIAHATLPEQYKQLPPEVLYNAILDQLIQQIVLVQESDGAVSRQIELSIENERRSLIAADQIEKIMAGAANESEIQSAYDVKYAEGFGGDEFNASHILVETEDEAKAIKVELDAGANFAETAKAKSTGPSGPNGGALGWFGLGAMVPAFETAVVGMKAGDVSEPVQTQFGWHLIILNEKRKESAPELASVHDELANQLREDAVEARLNDLTAAANVDRIEIVDMKPEILKNLDLIGD